MLTVGLISYKRHKQLSVNFAAMFTSSGVVCGLVLIIHHHCQEPLLWLTVQSQAVTLCLPATGVIWRVNYFPSMHHLGYVWFRTCFELFCSACWVGVLLGGFLCVFWGLHDSEREKLSMFQVQVPHNSRGGVSSSCCHYSVDWMDCSGLSESNTWPSWLVFLLA